MIVSLILASLLAQATPAASAPPSPVESIDQVVARGRMLAQYDKAAWQGSDAAMAIAKGNTNGLEMFIAHQSGKDWVVDFGKLSSDGTSFLTVYESVSSNGAPYVAQPFSPARSDTGFNVAAAHAIRLTEADFKAVANRRYNVAVLPNPDGTLLVYLYPAQTQTGVFPIGGDERYHVSADGMTILDAHRMHNSILDISPVTPNGSHMVSGWHTDVMSDIPEDTDVYHVLVRTPALPDYVDARGHMFIIQPDGSIEATKGP